MKYKIRATFEVTFDTDNSEHLDGYKSALSQNDREQLATEWLYEGCDLISEELVPSLVGHQIQLVDYRLDALLPCCRKEVV